MNLRGMNRWLPSYVASAARRRDPQPGEPIHVYICIADHFEPRRDGASRHLARQRIGRWLNEYPRLFSCFRDSAGNAPRHTFFYPAEEYEPELLDQLAILCRAGFGDVEVHLHHDNDSPDNFRRTLTEFTHHLSNRHGLLSRDEATGNPLYGFIHGNWALNNSRPDGRYCGINDEISILKETGCYADFTQPAAPSPCQTRMINTIYWARGCKDRPRGHERGVPIGVGPPPGSLLMIPGPLLLNWRRRKWGIAPRIENACLQATQPPSMERLDLWLRAGIRVPGRPHEYFVKLHTHGALEANANMLLGAPMIRFHQGLRERASRDSAFRFSYVTAKQLHEVILRDSSSRRAQTRHPSAKFAQAARTPQSKALIVH